MPTADRDRLRARLRAAERRLTEAERAQINRASAQYSGYAGTDQGHGDSIGDLNRQIADATGIDELRAEVVRLREELGDDPRPSLWSRLRRLLGQDGTDS